MANATDAPMGSGMYFYLADQRGADSVDNLPSGE